MATSTFSFPYQDKFLLAGFKRVVNPLISVPVMTKEGWQSIWFLLDSGADLTMMTFTLAKKLGLFYKKEKSYLIGIGEKKFASYEGKVLLKLGGTSHEVRCSFIDAPDSTFLLGRLDIFDKFDIHFKSSEKKIVFSM